MEEQKVKKREWVKNAAIIFLAVMLVLTFFSNTILNRTLPEVVTRYVEPGSIDAKVRISGTVSARESYDVTIDQTRKVASVNVKVGQEVSTGDLLFTLESGDSDELEQARKDLKQLQLDYQRSLLNGSYSDYSKENRDIALAQEALNKAVAARDALPAADAAAISAAEQAVKAAEAELEAAKAAADDLSAQIKAAEFGMSYFSQLTAAEAAVKAAENNLRAARIANGVNEKSGRYFAVKRIAMNQILNVKRNQAKVWNPYSDEEKANILAYMDQELPNDRKLTPTAREQEIIDLMPYYMEKVTQDPEILTEEQHAAYNEVTKAKEAYATASDNLLSVQETVRKAAEGGLYGLAEGKTREDYEADLRRLDPLLQAANKQKAAAEKTLAAAQETHQTLKDQKTAWDAAEAEVASAQRRLEDLLFALSEQKKSDGKSQALESLARQELEDKIAETEARIEELSGSTATEVRAKVNGTVAALSVSAGHKAEAEKVLASIEVKDLGYTMTVTVPADQARLLHVGDTANVSNYYWGSRTTAVLSSIQPDPKDPRSNRVLSFDLAGDINAGDKISFAVGEKNATYDLVVPNSAVRSDTGGSFVLMITAKNSPLGNRYFATRVDVEVLASDDYNTAVKGALSNMDSVITTSSGNAPVKNGDQVRLADTNNG